MEWLKYETGISYIESYIESYIVDLGLLGSAHLTTASDDNNCVQTAWVLFLNGSQLTRFNLVPASDALATASGFVIAALQEAVAKLKVQ